MRVRLQPAFVDQIVGATSNRGHQALVCPRCHERYTPQLRASDADPVRVRTRAGVRAATPHELLALVDGWCPSCAAPDELDPLAVEKARVEHELAFALRVDRDTAADVLAAHLGAVETALRAGDLPANVAARVAAGR